MKKTIPAFGSDAEAERFVETADLSQYDLTGGLPVRFKRDRPGRLALDLPEELVRAIEERARARGIPADEFVRKALEEALQSG